MGGTCRCDAYHLGRQAVRPSCGVILFNCRGGSWSGRESIFTTHSHEARLGALAHVSAVGHGAGERTTNGRAFFAKEVVEERILSATEALLVESRGGC